jgi:hypothetical protein
VSVMDPTKIYSFPLKAPARKMEVGFWAWEDVGMAIVNARAVRKLSLYPDGPFSVPRDNVEKNQWA